MFRGDLESSPNTRHRPLAKVRNFSWLGTFYGLRTFGEMFSQSVSMKLSLDWIIVRIFRCNALVLVFVSVKWIRWNGVRVNSSLNLLVVYAEMPSVRKTSKLDEIQCKLSMNIISSCISRRFSNSSLFLKVQAWAWFELFWKYGLTSLEPWEYSLRVKD